MEPFKRKWHKYFMYSWKRNRKYFVSKLCKLERKFFHTYKMHFYLLITTWYILTFELSVRETPISFVIFVDILWWRQSSRKRRIRRIFMPIFASVRVKFPSEDSHLRSVATGHPNWSSKTYRGLPKFLLSIEIDTQDVVWCLPRLLIGNSLPVLTEL